MASIGEALADIGYMDTLAAGDTPLHRLDPRVKLFTTLLFILAVVSCDKYAVSALVPFSLYPVYLIAAGELPAGYLARKMLFVAPFAFFVGAFNPFLDRRVLLHLGPLAVSGGWVSFFSIMGRFALTVSAALAMLSLTGIGAVCEALAGTGVPRPFVVQLLFLNRYLLALTGEAGRMSRARSLRAFDRKPMSSRIFVQMAGHLLLRAMDRAERVYRAMVCRGFDGNIRAAPSRGIGRAEAEFALVWAVLFAVFRTVNLPVLLGRAVMGYIK